MADINIDLNLDLGGSSQSLKKLKTELDDLKKNSKDITLKLVNDPSNEQLLNSLKEVNEQVEILNQQTEEINEEVDKLAHIKFDNLTGQVAKTGVSFKQLQEAAEILESKLGSGKSVEANRKLANELGLVRARLEELDREAEIFNGGGTRVEQNTKRYQQMGEALSSLNFREANRLSMELNDNTNKLPFKQRFKEAATGLKTLGTSFGNIGKALLTNPLFLMGTIVTVIIAILDKLGLMTVIFDGIGKVVDMLLAPIKQLLDYLGLTTYEQEKNTKASLKSAERTRVVNDAAIQGIEDKIALYQAEGRAVYDLEVSKQQLMQKTLVVEGQATRKELALLRKQGKAEDSDEIIEVKNKLTEIKTNYESASTQILTIRQNEKNEKKAKLDQEAEDEKNAREKSVEEYKIFLQKKKEADAKYALEELEISKTKFFLDEQKKAQMIKDSEARIQAKKQETIDLNTAVADANAEFQAEVDVLAFDKANAEERERINKESDKKILEARKAAIQESLKVATTSVSIVSNLSDAIYSNQLAKVKKGSKEEEAIKKKQFEMNKKFQIANAIITGIQSAMSAFSAYAGIPVVGPVIGGVAAAAVGITTGIQVAAIRNTKFEGGGSVPDTSGGSISGSSTDRGSSATTPMQPSFNLFGRNSNNNTATPTQTVSNQPATNITVKAVVSETEITETQVRVNRIKENSEL